MARLTAALFFCTALAAEPAKYQMILSATRGQNDRQLAELIGRQLPEVEIRSLSLAQRYRQYPHFPVAACTGEEFFALGYGRRLVAFGCLTRENVAIEVRRVKSAIAADVRGRPNTVQQAIDAALASLAAGERRDARNYTKDATELPGGAAEQGILRRLQQLTR